MNDYLKDARDYIWSADAQENKLAAQMAQAAAAIAQAEAAERQAVAMERLVALFERMGCEESVNGDLAFSVKLWGER